ncbi:MAG: DarT ssDNA thymidine ADP-ribosyltransferase family protein [Sedimenticola sp.]
MSIEEQIAAREITEILHFTTNRGLVGSLAKGFLLSRPLLSEDYLKYVLHLNAEIRPEEASYFDKSEDWIRFVNLSVSEVNSRFLNVSRRWHTSEDVWWAILAFSPTIVTHNNVWFSTTNNGYDGAIRGIGESGFSNLFAPNVLRKSNGYSGNWSCSRSSRESRLSTCEQAEVLYPEKLDLQYLNKVYVEDETHYDLVKGWVTDFELTEVCVEINKQKFIGKPN